MKPVPGVICRPPNNDLKRSIDEMSNILDIVDAIKPVFFVRPSSPAKAVAQNRWSLITGCTQNHFGIIMNVYTYVCIIYTVRQAGKHCTNITGKRSLIHFVFRTMHKTRYYIHHCQYQIHISERSSRTVHLKITTF